MCFCTPIRMYFYYSSRKGLLPIVISWENCHVTQVSSCNAAFIAALSCFIHLAEIRHHERKLWCLNGIFTS